jgi:hypothetical protein
MAFLRWWESEAERDGWIGPILKVSPPKIRQVPLEGVQLPDLRALFGDVRKANAYRGSGSRHTGVVRQRAIDELAPGACSTLAAGGTTFEASIPYSVRQL